MVAAEALLGLADYLRTVSLPGAAHRMAKSHLRLVTPATVNRTVRPKRPPNGTLRTREYLTEAEVERLMKVAKRNRWGHRDVTMVLVAYRHGPAGLRASGPAVGAGRFQDCHAARAPGQAGDAKQ
jgi:hypothetical protein